MSKKEYLAKLVAIYQDRINQVDKKLKEQNLSVLQRNMFETEKRIANEDIKKLKINKIT